MAILCLSLLNSWIRCVCFLPHINYANVDSRFGKLCRGLGDSELAEFCQQEEEGLSEVPPTLVLWQKLRIWATRQRQVFPLLDATGMDSKNFIQTRTGPSSTERVDLMLIAHSRGVFRLDLNCCFFAACWGHSHLCVFMGLWLTEGGSINHTASHLWQASKFTEISRRLSFCPPQHCWELGVGRHYYTFVRQ